NSDVTELNLTHVEDINEEKINIKEAVDYLVDAWENQDILDNEMAYTNQFIEDLGADALNDFCDLKEKIPTEGILNKNDIIKLIQEEMNGEKDNLDNSEDEL
ncbi:4554_t:CDS:2, partial [Paraglomus occultum]